MKKIIFLFICLVACTESVKIPENILSKARMVAILTEIHIAESKVSQSSFAHPDSALLAYRVVEKDIFKKLKMDTATFNRSYAFYANYPKLLEEIYTIVVDSLSFRESIAKTQTIKQNQIDKPKIINPADTVKKK